MEEFKVFLLNVKKSSQVGKKKEIIESYYGLNKSQVGETHSNFLIKAMRESNEEEEVVDFFRIYL